MILGAVLVLMGATVLYLGGRDMLHVRRLRRDGRAAVGTVTGHERRASGARSVIVAYADEHGATHQLTSSLSSSSPTADVGETVTVRYLPGDPDSARVDERRENSGTVVLTGVLGIGFAVAGVVLALTD